MSPVFFSSSVTTIWISCPFSLSYFLLPIFRWVFCCQCKKKNYLCTIWFHIHTPSNKTVDTVTPYIFCALIFVRNKETKLRDWKQNLAGIFLKYFQGLYQGVVFWRTLHALCGIDSTCMQALSGLRLTVFGFCRASFGPSVGLKSQFGLCMYVLGRAS